MWACFVSIAVGLWVMISPAVFGLQRGAANLNHICGPLLITFAIIALWDINKTVIKTNILVAVCLVTVTFFLDVQTIVTVSNLFAGLIALACCFVKRNTRQQFGGGWKSLFQKQPHHLLQAEKNTPV